MFVDRVKVFAQAGNGGRGSVSFRREKFVPKGGPDGGDGGRGGNVILQADRHVDNLVNLFYEPLIKAKRGGHGMGKKMSGRAGADKIVKVPVGTVVWLADKGPVILSEGEGSVKQPNGSVAGFVDFARNDRCGNSSDRSARDGRGIRSVSRRSRGERGMCISKARVTALPANTPRVKKANRVISCLSLRTIADAGLVGYPNAGKSTLLRKISAARPKVAAYPFTTLHPIVGVIEFPGYRRATVADIPGLIEGAHRGLGLGHEFLRHITRCRVLVFVVDIAGSEGRNPVEDLQNLRREIDLYDPTLSSRAWFVVANKMDLPGAKENLKALHERFPKLQILPTSAAKGEGIDDLKQALATQTADPEESVSAAI